MLYQFSDNFHHLFNTLELVTSVMGSLSSDLLWYTRDAKNHLTERSYRSLDVVRPGAINLAITW